MSFSVRPAALFAFADTLFYADIGDPFGPTGPVPLTDGLAASYRYDNTPYVEQYLTCDTGPGVLMRSIHDETTKYRAAVIAANEHFAQGLQHSAAALVDSAVFYANHDRTAAEDLDRSYHAGTHITPLDRHIDVTSQPQRPAAVLHRPPGTNGPIPDVVEEILGLAGWFTIGTEAQNVFADLTGFDLRTWLTERVGGDWDQIATVRNATRNLARFDQRASAVVADGLTTMLYSWTGNAAIEAQDYFDRVANALRNRAESLYHISLTYDSILLFLDHVLKPAFEDAIGAIVDLMVLFVTVLIFAPEAGVLLLEGVGEAEVLTLLFGTEVAELVEIVDGLAAIWTVLQSIYADLLVGLSAAINSLLARHGVVDTVPSGSYHNDSLPQGRPSFPGVDEPYRRR